MFLLKLSTAASTWSYTVILYYLKCKLKNWRWTSNTLSKSTEKVSSSCKTRAPFSNNQLNCRACPLLKKYIKSLILNEWTSFIKNRKWWIMIYPWASSNPKRTDLKHPARNETYIDLIRLLESTSWKRMVQCQ